VTRVPIHHVGAAGLTSASYTRQTEQTFEEVVMKKHITGAALLIGLLSLGTAPVVAGHYHGHAKYGYGAGKGMAPKAMTGRYCCAYRSYHHGKSYKHGKSYGKGYHRHGWKGHHRGGYKRGWSKGYGYGRSMQPYGQKHYGQQKQYGQMDYGKGKSYPEPMNDYAPAKPQQQAPASAPASQPAAPALKAAPQTIVDVAVSAGQFGTLVSAVKAADLVETLSGDGPFTVFAPTDEAFAKLPEGTVSGLLKDKDALTGVLTYHVVAGRLEASDLVEQGKFETVNGATLELGQLDVAKSDISASNGVIHVIDAVLLPPSS
jgi:uncharacterized surface protein with fasciclin (FAS1) repeats